MELQVEPETAAHFSVEGFKKWKAQKATEASTEAETKADGESTQEAEPESTSETHQEADSNATSAPEQDPETDYVIPRVLTEEEKRERKLQKEQEAKRRAQEVADLNRQYAGLNPAKKSLKDLLLWEEDYAWYWKHLHEGIWEAGAVRLEDRTRLEEPVFYTTDTGEIHKTIEAQCGHFFKERARALRDAINSSELSPDEKKKQLAMIDALWELAARHMKFKNMTKEEIRNYGADYQESSRTRTHNRVIEALNNLNNLARKYNLTPFTPRNFMTSEYRIQTPAMKVRMRYDRDLVEEYYAIAFSRELAEEKKKAKDMFSGFFGGSDY